MSSVTTVLVVHGDHEAEAVKAWLDTALNAPLGLVDIAAGDQHPECRVLAGAYNYLDRQRLIEKFLAYRWEVPTEAVLVMNRMDDDSTVVFYAFDRGEH